MKENYDEFNVDNKLLKKVGWSGFKIIAAIMVVMFMLSGLGMIFGWFGNAAAVAKKEFSPEASLKKYEWFIDASEQINKLDSDIKVYKDKQDMLCVEGMDRIAREQCMTWGQEVAGIKSAYNDVVADYNAQSRKFNWDLYNTQKIQTSYVRK